MKDVIAERRLIAVNKTDGTRINVCIRVGKPYSLVGQDAECPVEITGLFESVAPARGIDTFQALELALEISHVLKVKSDEYDFYYADGGYHYFDESVPNISV
jgi:hypothetical protein